MPQSRVVGTRRVWLPATVLGAFALVVLGRLIQLQVLEHDDYAEQAREEQSGEQETYGRRGSILDRNGNVLATSVDTWDIYVSARAWRDDDRAMPASELLGAALHLDPITLRETVRQKEYGDVVVARDIDFEVGRDLLDSHIDGVVGVPNTARIHPDGDVGASILGFTGADNTGLAGVEASLNTTLQGTPGQAFYERDSEGNRIPFGQYVATQPVPGKDVVLTIDRYLQQLAEERLADAIQKHQAKGGTIIIMDPTTGEILALASSPGLKYSTLDAESPDLSLLRNRAVTDLYEPGSVMKAVTAASAVDAGVVTPDTWYVDTGYAYIGDKVIKNWQDNVYGSQTMTGVLQNSINTGAIFMMNRLGPDRFMTYLDAFGFGVPTGIELQGEAGGIFRRPGDDGWSVVDPATQSFGQAISVTPVQMATALSAVINGGNLVKPHLVKSVIDQAGHRHETPITVVDRAISAQSSATLREMLKAVVNPGWRHPGQPRDYIAGGKSATANVPVSNGYDDTQIASFAGFAPVTSPRILVLVKIDENADLKTGTEAAAPYVAGLIDDTLHYLNVTPDAGQYVEAR